MEGSFENQRTILTANDNIILRTSPDTIGVSPNPLPTLIQENGAEPPPNRSLTSATKRFSRCGLFGPEAHRYRRSNEDNFDRLKSCWDGSHT